MVAKKPSRKAISQDDVCAGDNDEEHVVDDEGKVDKTIPACSG